MGRVKDLAIERDSYDFYGANSVSISISGEYGDISIIASVVCKIKSETIIKVSDDDDIEIEDKLNYDFIKALKEL